MDLAQLIPAQFVPVALLSLFGYYWALQSRFLHNNSLQNQSLQRSANLKNLNVNTGQEHLINLKLLHLFGSGSDQNNMR